MITEFEDHKHTNLYSVQYSNTNIQNFGQYSNILPLIWLPALRQMVLLTATMNPPRGRRASTITPVQMEELKLEFQGIDRDGNGEVSVEELEVLLRSMRVKLRLSESEIRRSLKIIDTDGDGTVDMKELTNIIEQYDTDGVIYKALSQRLEIRKEFQKYDKDNSGFITRDELVQVVKDRTGMAISERHLEGMLQGCDENDDGQMDYEEFCTLMTKSFMRKKIVGRSKTALSALQTIKGE